MKRKIIRRVVDKTYDNFLSSDYSAGQDNLNPIRHMAFSKQIADLEDAVDKKVDMAIDNLVAAISRNKSGLNQEFALALNEASGSLSDLANALKGGSFNGKKYPNLGDTTPDWLLNKIDRSIAFGLYGSPELRKEVERLHIPIVDCNGVANIAEIVKNDALKNGGNGAIDLETFKKLAAEGVLKSSDDGDENSTKVFDITYKYIDGSTGEALGADIIKHDNHNMVSCFRANLPLTLYKPTVLSEEYTFIGFYEDAAFTKHLGTKYSNANLSEDITIYGKVKLTSELTDEELALINGGSSPDDIGSVLDDMQLKEETSSDDGDADDITCALTELTFLKYILIVIRIVKIICKIVNIAIYLLKTIAQLVGKAGTCWNDPPIIADIIADVVQRIIALVVSIIAKLLQKLWDALGFDCVGTWTMDMIGQIMNAMAGINGAISQVNATAVNFSSAKADLSPKATFQSMKDTLQDSLAEAKEQLKNMPNSFMDQLKTAGDQSMDALKGAISPQTLMSMVPSDAKEMFTAVTGAVNNAISSYKGMAKNLEASGKLISKNWAGAGNSQIKKSEVLM